MCGMSWTLMGCSAWAGGAWCLAHPGVLRCSFGQDPGSLPAVQEGACGLPTRSGQVRELSPGVIKSVCVLAGSQVVCRGSVSVWGLDSSGFVWLHRHS